MAMTMLAKNAVVALAIFAAYVGLAAADVIYLHCPTVFTKSVSTIKANYFKGASPLPACNGLNVSVDGQPALATWCISNGLMGFNLSTPVAKTYNITAVSNSSTLIQPPEARGDGTTVSCTVRRSSFNVSITVPEFNYAILPVTALAAVLLLRLKRSRGVKRQRVLKP